MEKRHKERLYIFRYVSALSSSIDALKIQASFPTNEVVARVLNISAPEQMHGTSHPFPPVGNLPILAESYPSYLWMDF